MQEFQDAFISYGRADSKAFATKLYERLLQAGQTVWFDQNDIPLGVDFQNQIDDGLEKSHNFLFIIAPHSINSPYCGKEIDLALRRNKRIIPLLHVEQITQETWQQRNPERDLAEWEAYKAKGLHSSFPNMHPAIGKINWVYFREGIDDFEKSFAGLLEIFDRHRSYVEQHTYLLAKSLDWERYQRQPRYLLIGEERLAAEQWLNVQFKDEQAPCVPTDLHCEFICESTKNANNLMTQVFLSYSEKEREVMEKVARSLMREGFTVWTNKTDIKTGEDFQTMIDRGIEEADNVVFLMSPASLASQYCQQELVYARLHHKRLIPLLITPMDMAEVPPELRAIQHIDMTDHANSIAYQENMDKLVRVLREESSYYEQHKILLAKALKWERQKGNPSVLLRGHNLRQAEAWLKVAQGRSHCSATNLQQNFIAESLKQPPETTLDVFLCYSRTDSDFARKLNDGLQVQGQTTWFDQESVAAGDDLQQELRRGIERCNNLLFLISPASVVDPACVEVVNYAAQLNKRVVTAIYQGVNADQLHPALSGVQAIDFRRHEGDFFTNFGDLVRALAVDPEYVQAHTRLLVRSLEWEQNGQDDSYLLRAKDLQTSEQWFQTEVPKEPKLNELQQQYLVASRELPRRRIKRRTVLFSSLAVTALISVARWFGITQPVELWAYDRLLTLRPNEAQDSRMLIVAVDEPTLAMLPQKYEPSWGTLPDRALDEMLTKLSAANPKLIGIDFIRDYASKPPLAKRLQQTQNSIFLCKSTGSDGTIQGQGVKPPPEVPPERLGFANIQNDDGKFLRRHLLMQAPDETYCNSMDAFSLVLARAYLNSQGKPFTSPLNDQGEITHSLQFGNTPVPQLVGDGSGYRDRDGQLDGYQTLLNFRAVDGKLDRFAPMVSLKDVLDNKVSPEMIRDRIVMVGITADTSTKADYWKTPYGEVPGVILQSQMVSQLVSATLDGRSLIRWMPFWAEIVWIFGWSLVGGLLVWQLYRVKHQAIAGGIALIVLSGTCYIFLTTTSLWIPLVPAGMVLVTTGAIVGAFTYRLRHP